MDIIVHGNMNCLKFFSRPREGCGSLFIPSRYMIRQAVSDGVLLCSTLTGELALLNPEEVKYMGGEPVPFSSETADLIAHRFLVPRDVPENRTVDQLHSVMLKRREAKNVINNYSVLTTTYCNARCFYCFESGIRHVHMSEETADRLVRFITEHHGESKVKLAWFGGEPLLGRRRIDRICQGLSERGVVFTSTMTSNGYLFDPESVHRASEVWNLKRVQITLDGTEKLYNKIKAYVSPDDNPYRRVMHNIGLLSDAGIYVNIRLNLDSHNGQDLALLIRELSERFPERKKISVYVSILNEGLGFDPISHTAGDREKLHQTIIGLWDLLKKQGWPVFGASEFPQLKDGFCIASSPYSIQCTPDGIFSKCTGSIYENPVGNLTEGITDTEKIIWWRQRSPFDGCEACPLYPSCTRHLVHCPSRTPCIEEELKGRIEGYKELMIKKYEDRKTEISEKDS